MNDKKEKEQNQDDSLSIKGSLDDVLKVSIPKPKEKETK